MRLVYGNDKWLYREVFTWKRPHFYSENSEVFCDYFIENEEIGYDKMLVSISALQQHDHGIVTNKTLDFSTNDSNLR